MVKRYIANWLHHPDSAGPGFVPLHSNPPTDDELQDPIKTPYAVREVVLASDYDALMQRCERLEEALRLTAAGLGITQDKDGT